MKKTFYFLTPVILFLFTAFAVSARDIKCTVVSVQNSKVIVDCGKKAIKIKAGAKVTLKPSPKRNEQLHGC